MTICGVSHVHLNLLNYWFFNVSVMSQHRVRLSLFYCKSGIIVINFTNKFSILYRWDLWWDLCTVVLICENLVICFSLYLHFQHIAVVGVPKKSAKLIRFVCENFTKKKMNLWLLHREISIKSIQQESGLSSLTEVCILITNIFF